MKRILALLLSAILAVTMCACSQNVIPSSSVDDTSGSVLATEDIQPTESAENSLDSEVDTFESSQPESKEEITENTDVPQPSNRPTISISKQDSNEETVTIVPSSEPSADDVPTQSVPEDATESTTSNQIPSTEPPAEQEKEEETVMPASDYKIKITVGGQELTATIYNNATGRDFIDKLPLTLPMLDLYGREMCYRFPDSLETDNVQYTGYEVGEIVYWPPRHSFVILYAQNGEQFEMQKIGRIDSGVEIFNGIGNVDVTFELISD